MKTIIKLFGLSLAICLSFVATAQYDLSPGELEKVPVSTMPAQDNASLLAAELAERRPGRANTFAVTIPVQIRPANAGAWTTEGPTSIWRHRVNSPGAHTLNFGFSEYNLPAGAELYLLSTEEKIGPFTPADNADHNQLWTPILESDEVMVELRVPTKSKGLVQLYLTSVNHDFQDVTKSLSGSCNLDVICGEDDGWAIVDPYRDIIRSVAAYTLGGVDQCTGFLVNNTNNDGAPLFMTANHCNVTAGSDQSLVAYWNFQSSECRPVNSTASGGNGGGSRAIFNSGTVHLASNPASDMTITMLEEAVNPAANAFYAGWSNEAPVPQDTVICIHHPGVDEKRISFSFNQTYRTNNGGGTPDVDGSLLEVPSWSIGTTEGGSSGSPIFDRFKRVRGQLFGGQASCTNDSYDVYGYFHVSWTGGGTPETRLMDWLDPCGTGVVSVDGFDSADLPLTLVAAANCVSGCGATDTEMTFTLGSGFPAGTALSITDQTAGITPVLSTSTAAGGEAVTVTVPGNVSIAEGDYTITVTAGSGNTSDDITFFLELFNEAAASAPAAILPVDGGVGIKPTTAFQWSDVAGATSYDVELSTTDDFSVITDSGAGLMGTSASPDLPLDGNTTYYWRIRSNGACGPGEWAEYSFTTLDQTCAAESSANLPAEITGAGMPTITVPLMVGSEIPIEDMEVRLDIAHTFVGDLEATLTSPDGASIQLFNSPFDGNCGFDNISVVFSDDATLTAADFVNTCDEGDIAVSGIYQPAESFAAFASESSAGEWILTVNDLAGGDGGAVVTFDITFCGQGGVVRDFSVFTNTESLVVCPSDEASIDFSLGTSFTDAVAVRVSTSNTQLDNFTSSYDGGQRLLTVDFTGWAALTPGNYDLTFTVVAEDSSERDIIIPLTVNPDGLPAVLVSPEDGAELMEGTIRLDWDAVTGATNYTVQYSVNEDFSTIDFEDTRGASNITVADVPVGQVIYWRVLTNNDCSPAVSAVRTFRIRPVGVQNFGQGRVLNIYPNPVRGQLTVEATGSFPGGLSADLYDATGRFLRTYPRLLGGRNQVDLNGIAAGVYYLRLATDGEERTERLVVLP
ncbi:T9SS type A sorting domain-containing protein [Neolewinella agarilytica]|uniref:Por secretion system C-terminal sorting domain-containing protein n=1 Tax=Neolewinella agarilytica TaxID=478744 RepID=A0A1H9JGV3_9BACT|nr:proprotein convertase P-domain-containing protein [Neolewinella agarilytica]SEQ86221.1 Por secretion system C-terminal sorting domain-containing protein [Neolewinella agarilytica]